MKVPFRIKAAYGTISVADQCVFFLFGTFFLFFITTVVGIDPAVAGIIASFGALCDGVMAVLFGYLSDHCSSRLGKRRIFVLCSSFPMAIITMLIFTKVDLSPNLQIAYYLIMVFLYWSGFTSFYIPYMAWGAELTDDYNERTILRLFTYVGGTVGMALGSVFPSAMTGYLLAKGVSGGDAWRFTGGIIGAVVFLVLFAGAFFINPAFSSNVKQKTTKTNAKSVLSEVIRGYAEICRIKPVYILMAAGTFYLIANTIYVADRVYFYTYNMGLGATLKSGLLAIGTFIGIIYFPLMAGCSKIMDKRRMFIYGMSVSGIVMIAMKWVGAHTIIGSIIIIFAYGLSSICYWELMPAMTYDLCEVDEYENGKRREGAIVSLMCLIEAISEAIGVFGLGQLLSFAGFAGENNTQSAEALTWIENSFTVIPGVFMLFSCYMVYKYPITKEVYDEMVRKIKERSIIENQK